MFMPTSAKKCDAKVLPTNSTTPKWVNPTVTSLIHSYLFGALGVKLNVPTKHAKQTSQDFLKLAGKTWIRQRWPDNKHAKQSMGQEIKTCKQGLNMTGVTRKEACQTIDRSSKHANEHVCAKEDLEMLAVIFARTVPVANKQTNVRANLSKEMWC